jgi:hypothetical protein
MRLALLAAFTIAAAALAEEPGPFLLDQSGELPSGKSYRLVIHEAPYQRRPLEQPDDGSRWGIDGGFPRFYVEELTLTLGKLSVWIPRKFHTDLSHVHRASMQEQRGAVVLRLEGGDAAGSFAAEFRFRGGNFVERLVRHGEFPDEVWERTIYRHQLP